MSCRIVLLLAFVFTARVNAADALFFGQIPAQYAKPGEALSLDLHRFLHPPSAQVSTDDETARCDQEKFSLSVKVPTEGLKAVKVTASDGRTTIGRIIVLAALPQTPTHFIFKPPTTASKVAIGGAFNGWSKSSNPMEGPDAEGQYSIDLDLAPGRYAYKFVVDGEWALDPTNSLTEDSGTGDKNSVILIENGERSPTIFFDRREKDKLVVRCVGGDMTSIIAVAQTPTNDIICQTKVEGEAATIQVPPGATAVRVIARAGGKGVTNSILADLHEDAWRDAILYYALTDRFVDGDKSNDRPVTDERVLPPANYHGGDLRGLRQKIEDGYFQKLGVNALWISPLNRNPAGAYQESPEPHRWYTGYHGYWPISSTEIDPHLGTAADLRGLINTAHARKMKVIADLVLHHVHAEHPWWKEHRDWFGSLELPDGRKNLRLWDEQQFTTWFEPYLPSFDFSKPAPVRALIDNTVWWATQYQLDGFRLDAVKHILPSFWWQFRAALRQKVKHPLYLVGETFKDRAGIDAFVGPNMLDGQFDFPLYDSIKDALGTGSAPLGSVDDALVSSEHAYGKGTLMSPLIGNHDKGRFMAYADGDLPDPVLKKEEEVGWQKPPEVNSASSYAKLKLAQALLLAIDGVPMIYYGDEIGMTGAGDPDNRRDMRFHQQLTSEENDVRDHFAKLTALRRSHPALRGGSRRTLLKDADGLAFVRAQFADRVLVVINRANQPRTMALDLRPEIEAATLTDLLSNAAVELDQGNIVVPPMTALFLAPRSVGNR